MVLILEQIPGNYRFSTSHHKRVVENETGCMMLVDQRVAEFRPELLFLVGAEGHGVLVDCLTILEARQEISAVRHELDGRKGS